MARLILTAQACTFTITATGFKGREHLLTAPPLAREGYDIKKTAEVAELVNAFRAEMEAANPGKSFFIYQALAKGDRAPAGYRDLPYVIAEIDHDTEGGACTTPLLT